MDLFSDPQLWIAFFTLLTLEIILGIDNVVFISILAGKLPEHQRARARTLGLSLALVMRIILLFSLSWIIGLTDTLFTVVGQDISGRDLILILGGAFLVAKATYEIHERLEGEEAHGAAAATASFGAVIVQILALDVVFSLDSVITAVGMVDQLSIMVAAVTIAIVIMLVSAGAISDFVNRHPTVKMLALAFLVLIGASLLAEGFDFHTPKGYIYGPIAFALVVEALNLRYKAIQGRRKHIEVEPVHLRPAYLKEDDAAHPTER
jgi:predicted tellurium resistance membrane protein TerC